MSSIATPDAIHAQLLPGVEEAGWLSSLRARQLTWALVGLGILLRVVIWWQARSVYLDEVALLRNFVERDYAGLFQALRYEQYAPPFFSVLMKAVVGLLGNGERAIRLVPMLAGCAMLGLFRTLALRWLPPLWAVLVIPFVAFSSLYLDFATVCKQYSTDTLVAVGLLVLAERQLRQPLLTGRAALGWAALGAALVWASMPAVFVLAGVGLALAWAYRAALPGAAGWWLLGVGAAWGVSFLLYFKLLLLADAQSDYLQNYHRDAFLAFPPRSAAQWALLGNQFLVLADKGFGKTTLAVGLAGVGVLAGSGYLLRRPTARTWLLLVPALACLAASALHYYALAPRLLLFLLPLLLLVLFTGLAALAARWRWVGVGLALGVAITIGSQQRLKYFVLPFQADYADVRAGLAYVAQHQQADEAVFIYHNEQQLLYYYQTMVTPPIALRNVVSEYYRDTPHNDLIQQDVLALAATGQRRIWLLYDRSSPWLREWAAAHGTITQLQEFHEGYVFRLEVQ